MNKVQIRSEQSYGNTRFYPVNNNAKRFTDISGKKTISLDDMENIKRLGFDIEVVPNIHPDVAKICCK